MQSINYLLLCDKLPQTHWLTTAHICDHTVSVGQEFGYSSARLQSRCRQGMGSHLKVPLGGISSQAHSHGCWQDPAPVGCWAPSAQQPASGSQQGREAEPLNPRVTSSMLPHSVGLKEAPQGSGIPWAVRSRGGIMVHLRRHLPRKDVRVIMPVADVCIHLAGCK